MHFDLKGFVPQNTHAYLRVQELDTTKTIKILGQCWDNVYNCVVVMTHNASTLLGIMFAWPESNLTRH